MTNSKNILERKFIMFIIIISVGVSVNVFNRRKSL